MRYGSDSVVQHGVCKEKGDATDYSYWKDFSKVVQVETI
jgi:hypothetical protein